VMARARGKVHSDDSCADVVPAPTLLAHGAPVVKVLKANGLGRGRAIGLERRE
jgi:hypothetical protein